MARKISAPQLRALQNGAAHPRGIISPSEFQTRTVECLVGLGFADWDHRTGVVTDAGRAYLATLDATDVDTIRDGRITADDYVCNRPEVQAAQAALMAAMAATFEPMVGTVRTDHRGMRYRVAQARFKGASRFNTASVTVSGRVIDAGPLYDAYAAEIFHSVPEETVPAVATPDPTVCMYGDDSPVTHTVKNVGGVKGLCAEDAARYGYPEYLVPVASDHATLAPMDNDKTPAPRAIMADWERDLLATPAVFKGATPATDPQAFDVNDPATWTTALTPAGYEWREVNAETGEYQLFTPEGTNLSAMMDARNDKARTLADMVAEWDDSRHYPHVTAGMDFVVKRYCLSNDVELPDLDDKEAVRLFVENANTPNERAHVVAYDVKSASWGVRTRDGAFVGHTPTKHGARSLRRNIERWASQAADKA
jgi:hypothetical protein